MNRARPRAPNSSGPSSEIPAAGLSSSRGGRCQDQKTKTRRWHKAQRRVLNSSIEVIDFFLGCACRSALRWRVGTRIICLHIATSVPEVAAMRGICHFKQRLGRPGDDLLSRVLRRSTIGAGAFHGRVRNGIGCSHPAIITRSAETSFEAQFWSFQFLRSSRQVAPSGPKVGRPRAAGVERRPRGAAGAKAPNGSVSDYDEHCLMRAMKSIELLVPVSYTHCCASTPGLSTWWSSTTLEGELVLRWVSRLDAFSGYPVRT